MSYQLTKSKFIHGLQCEKALYLDVFDPSKGYYPKETLDRFKKGRDFERRVKDCFPEGIDVSAKMLGHMSRYAPYTAKMLMCPGPVTLYEAGFEYDGVLVLADIVTKDEDGSVTVYEVKDSDHVSEVFKMDVAIQHYVISHALEAMMPHDIFCTQLMLKQFYLAYRNEETAPCVPYQTEDLFSFAQVQEPFVATNISRFKQVLQEGPSPVTLDDHCQTPYPCPYLKYCGKGEL